MNNKTITSLADEFISISNQISTLEKQKEELKWIFQKYIINKDPNDFQSDFIISWTDEDIKITKSPKINILDKDKFVNKIKELWLFDEYADISRQNVNSLFLKSWKVKLKDFIWTVEEDTSFTIKKQKKSNKSI